MNKKRFSHRYVFTMRTYNTVLTTDTVKIHIHNGNNTNKVLRMK